MANEVDDTPIPGPCSPELAIVDVVRERSTRKLADSGEPHDPKVVTVTPTDQERPHQVRLKPIMDNNEN